MADNAYTTNPTGFSVLRTNNADSAIPLEWAVAGTPIAVGDAVTWSQTGATGEGLLVKVANVTDPIVGIAQSAIVQADCTTNIAGTTAVEVCYIPADAQVLYSAQLTANTVPQNLEISNVVYKGKAVDINSFTSGAMDLSSTLSTTGHGQFRIIDWVREYMPNSGDTNSNGRVVCAVYFGMYNNQVNAQV